MKKVLILVIAFFIITGCSNKDNNVSNIEKKVEKNNEIKTTISCYNEGFLFHSKKSVDHIMFLDKDNKLIKYEHIEKYFSFDDDNDFTMICEGAPEEAENNNKLYNYLNEVADCNKESKEVTITDIYDISKMESKNKIPSDEVKDNLNDDFILDVDGFKSAIGNKGYTCREM